MLRTLKKHEPLKLDFDQRMQLWQFRVRVILSFSAFYLGLAALILDLGIAKRYAPYLTSLVSFIIGWWMPSPGNPTPKTNQLNIESEKATILNEQD